MENEVGFLQKKQAYTELELAHRDKLGNNFSRRFNANIVNGIVILPLNPETTSLDWIVSSISHEYLHLILTEFESYDAGSKLDSLGYNLATGCIKKWKR